MMRVLWVYDGLSVHHIELANYLVRQMDVSLDVICRWDGQPPLDRSLAALVNLRCQSKIDFAARRTIRTRLQTHRFDIVHAYTSRALANTLAACRKLRFPPKVVGYRGTIDTLQWLSPADWITFWHRRLSKVICVSDAVNQAMRQSGVPDSKLATVWDGCSTRDDANVPIVTREEFQIPSDAFVVGLVANMRPVKGVDLLLQAAIELADLKNIYWLLIGDVRDPRIGELARDSRIANRVRLPGFRPNGGCYANLFDVFVSSSRKEGLGIAILEAMTRGVPIVSTSVGGCKEVVRNRREGLLVPPEDPRSLAEAIRALHDSAPLRQTLANAARQRAVKVFSIEAWATRLHSVYAELTERPSLWKAA